MILPLKLVSLILLSSLGLVSCSTSPKVTSEGVIEVAQAYHQHRWVPTQANVKHGFDAEGILIHTPDVSLSKEMAIRPGYWVANQTNVGLPYMWGGFDTVQSFDRKVKKGFYAGDVYTPQKRRLLEDGVSKFATGVDCSGFISRCWKLSRHYSTRELPHLCEELPSYQDLKAGDILNKHNDHVVLFWKFVDDSQTHFLAYEVGSPPSWVVTLNKIPVEYMKTKGYKPLRYKKMKNDESQSLRL